MDLSGHINDLITVATEQKNAPAADKKALNKAIARLEEAQLWAQRASSGKVNGVPTTSHAVHGSTSCTCPPGVVDYVNCPVHNQ